MYSPIGDGTANKASAGAAERVAGHIVGAGRNATLVTAAVAMYSILTLALDRSTPPLELVRQTLQGLARRIFPTGAERCA